MDHVLCGIFFCFLWCFMFEIKNYLGFGAIKFQFTGVRTLRFDKNFNNDAIYEL